MSIPTQFILSLYSIVTDVSNYGVIRWSSDGQYIEIVNSDKLLDILSRESKVTKLASFYRQLNYYGFRTHQRNKKNSQQCSFYHPNFTKMQPNDIKKIRLRRPSGGSNSQTRGVNKSRLSSKATKINEEEVLDTLVFQTEIDSQDLSFPDNDDVLLSSILYPSLEKLLSFDSDLIQFANDGMVDELLPTVIEL